MSLEHVFFDWAHNSVILRKCYAHKTRTKMISDEDDQVDIWSCDSHVAMLLEI